MDNFFLTVTSLNDSTIMDIKKKVKIDNNHLPLSLRDKRS